MKTKKSSDINRITWAIMLVFSSIPSAYAIEFNTDVLDAADKQNINFSRFSQVGYILPGKYELEIRVNDSSIYPSAITVDFIEMPEKNAGVSEQSLPQACLTTEMVSKMGLTEASRKKITYDRNGLCADFSQLPGVRIRPDMTEGVLKINIPQVWLEYSDASWLPPSRWDNGIPGLLLDYNINAMMNKPHREKQYQSLNYNGTMGANFNEWRLRADYQGSLSNTIGNRNDKDSSFTWNRVYLYRAIPHWHANLTLGENYINSDLFRSWRYTGISMESNERMLPPRLRGYAPQVSGIADTNARVVISQQGRILYDSTVPAGPFTIQDLDSSVRGRLDVEVIEQNGQKKTFQVNTAYVPYLTRPGQIRYKLISGRSRTSSHSTEGPVFAAAEASWGISNIWSLYGGSIVAGDYNALALGVGRDLNIFGTIAADVTQSVARFPGEETRQGKSWSLNYSKRFDEVNTDITFSGYRFSERDYMTMEQYLDARYHNSITGHEKEMYTITLNKNQQDWNTSVNLQYGHQTYWDRRTSNYYALSLNRYFDAFGFKNISAGISASRSRYLQKGNHGNTGGTYNDSLFLRLSVPWGTGTASYSGSISNDRYTNTLGYSDSLDGGLSRYSLNAGVNSGGGQNTQGQISGFYNHNYPLAQIAASFSAAEQGYTSFGINAS
ncbi:fimbria/pilus outer membrane usher protein, partial [Escherichia coli]|uniref:fimbria/pilus outer membrane usher protein n=1 Tax=Escherichia coli TaxID=562 RepID=UPI0021D3AAB6